MPEKIIIATRIIAPQSSLEIAPESGLNKATKVKKVSKTTMWAITLFPSFKPLNKAKKTTPANTGINAVTDGVSEPRYPINPTIIKIAALIALIWNGFIYY